MDKQSKLLLALVAVLLLLVGLDRWWEPVDPLGNPDATARVWDVVEDDLRRVEAVRDDGTRYVFQQDEDGWQVEEPFVGRGNQRVIRRMVSVLAEVGMGEPIEVDDPKPFGLGDPPVATIDVTDVAGVVHHLDLGTAAPSGWRSYVRGADGIIVIDGELELSVFVEENDLRDRHLLAYDPAAVRAVTLHSADGTLTIRGEGREWWVDGFARADLDAVEGLVAGLLDLQVENFLDDAFEGGMPEPVRTVTIELAASEPVVMHVGENSQIGTLVWVEGGTVGVIQPQAFALLGQGPTDVADRAAIPIRQVKPVGIDVKIPDGSWSVTLGENGWSRTGEEDLVSFDAVEQLRGVASHSKLTAAPALTKSWGTVTLSPKDGDPRVITLGQLDGVHRVAQDSAGGEPYWVVVEGLEAVAAVFD